MPRGKRAETRCRYLAREEARQKGWNIKHPHMGGDFLEEQEIEDYFPECGLGGEKPDFLVCYKNTPAIVVEAKNDINKIDAAVWEAVGYADTMNQYGNHQIKIAVGVAGEEDYGYIFRTVYRDEAGWVPLTSHDYELTGFPSVAEIDQAILTNNGTTEVTVPQVSDYIDAAIELSSILRSAKIEPSLRPKVLGAVITALYWGEIDTNPTVWSLAALNMFFRGDGKSHIENISCFEDGSRSEVRGKFTKALLNPPFSQSDEPERDFIAAAMESLQTLGLMAVVVKAGIFADDENALWRNTFLKRHTVLGLISLPGDLFYPTAVDTTIMIAQAHRPQREDDKVFMAKIWNDGYRKLKGKRVETEGSQLGEVLAAFNEYMAGRTPDSKLAAIVDGDEIMEKGAEFSPEQYLPQPAFPMEEQKSYRDNVTKSILKATVCIEDIADEVIETFPVPSSLPELPYGTEKALEDYFFVSGGRSRGESNYLPGTCPYISSGDPQNSIVRLVKDEPGEVFPSGGITVTCFGQACVQPWRFMARGNGGSAVRVLVPRYKMNYAELAWFASQINMQRWRFFYGRMAISKRIRRMKLKAPDKRLQGSKKSISEKIRELSDKMLLVMKE